MSKLMFEEKEILPEIVDVVFSDETRMPIPEKSHAQELLETPIPLENRIAHLIPYIEPTAELLSSHAIAKRIGAEEYWVSSVAKRIGIELLPNDSGEGAALLYPPLSLELLEEEWQWHVSYEALAENLSTSAIAEFMAKTSYWVTKYAQELGFLFTVEESSYGSRSYSYPKQVIPQLRHIILSHPPAGDWYTLSELEEFTGHKRTWISNNLGKVGVESEQRWLALAGRLSPHFPPNTPEIIQAIADKTPLPAGNWLNVETMARQLSKTRDWVNKRIEPFKESGEIRIGDNGNPRMHYPPEIYAALEVARELQPVQAGDWMTTNAIAQKLSRSYEWVSRRIETYAESSEIRIDSTGTFKTHYSPEVVEALRQESEPEHGDYLSVEMIVSRVGHSSAWIVKRLPFVTAESEEKAGKHGRPLMFYEPSIVDALLALPKDILHRHNEKQEIVEPRDGYMKVERQEKYSERLYNSRKAHNNLSTFLHDPAFSGTQLVNYGLNSIVAEVTAHCDQRTRDIVASYLIGVEILEIESIYNVHEGGVGSIISDAAKQVAAGYAGKSRR